MMLATTVASSLPFFFFYKIIFLQNDCISLLGVFPPIFVFLFIFTNAANIPCSLSEMGKKWQNALKIVRWLG